MVDNNRLCSANETCVVLTGQWVLYVGTGVLSCGYKSLHTNTIKIPHNFFF